MTLEEKEDKMTLLVKEKLDSIKFRIAYIRSYTSKDAYLRDGTRKTVIFTTFTEMTLGNDISVVTDPETMEMLYVQTGVVRFMEIEDFFKSE